MGPPSVAAGLEAPVGYEIGRSGNTLVLFDTATGQVGEPAVPDLDLASIAPVGDRTVGFTDDAGIVLFDHQGVAIDQRPFVSAVHGDFRGRAELVGGVPDSTLGIIASGSSIGFDVADDRIEVAWELLGRVGPPVDTAVGPVSIARTVHPVTAEIDVELIDVRSGTSIAVTDLGTTREADPVVVHDGYVAAPALGDPDREIRAVDFDGVERWTLATPPGSWYELAGGHAVRRRPVGGHPHRTRVAATRAEERPVPCQACSRTANSGGTIGFQAAWDSLGAPGHPGRISRIDRGWSTVMRHADDIAEPARIRNLFVDRRRRGLGRALRRRRACRPHPRTDLGVHPAGLLRG